MKALQLVDVGKFQVVDFDIPQIQPDELLVKVKFAGICGSDIHTYQGHNARIRYPLVMGHEFSGEVVRAGEQCADAFKAGDRVTVHPFISCGQCHSCRNARHYLCRQRLFTGFTVNGAFAEYVKIKAIQAHKLADRIPYEAAAMVEPYAVGVHAVNVANIQLGDHVAILGGGTIGMMIALAARAAGAGQIVMSEISDYRLDQIQKLGFIPIDSKVSDVKEEVFKLTGGAGTDIVFDAAGVPATAALMTQLLRSKGTAVIAGLYAHAPQVDLNDLNFRELVIRGTTVYTDQDFRFALQSLPVEELLQLVSHRLPIAEGEEGFRLSAGAKEAMKVLIQA